MRYALILYPFSNGRYEEAMRLPAINELNLLLGYCRINAKCERTEINGVGALCFECGELDSNKLSCISGHSMAFWLGIYDSSAFIPLCGPRKPLIGSDLASILKYRGKTNERFTQLLINLALCACKTNESNRKLLIDPMCGKGTTLFQALNMGFDAYGSDIDRKDLAEGLQFFIKYLQQARFKHKHTLFSQTIKDAPAVKIDEVALHIADEALCFRMAQADSGLLNKVYGSSKADLIVTDLPYGIQHAPGGLVSFEQLLNHVLPAWYKALKPGGAVAVSYNTFTLKTAVVRSAFKQHGFIVMEGSEWDGMSHWVEQAVTRDATVAVKPYQEG